MPISIPNTFTSGTTAESAKVNENFDRLGTRALDATGDTLTGNLAVSSGITIDGVDISAAIGASGALSIASIVTSGNGTVGGDLGVTGAATIGTTLAVTGNTTLTGTLTVNSTSASALDVAGGINAGSGNVGIVDTSGRIPAISSTYFASLSAANLTSVPAAQLTGSLPAISGASLTSLNASNISSGTLSDSRLSSNVVLKDGDQLAEVGGLLLGVATPAWSANVDNYALGDGIALIRASVSSSPDLTGMQGGVAGRVVILHNAGSTALNVVHESANSTAANRFDLRNNTDVSIGVDRGYMIFYDGSSSRWRLLTENI